MDRITKEINNNSCYIDKFKGKRKVIGYNNGWVRKVSLDTNETWYTTSYMVCNHNLIIEDK